MLSAELFVDWLIGVFGLVSGDWLMGYRATLFLICRVMLTCFAYTVLHNVI